MRGASHFRAVFRRGLAFFPAFRAADGRAAALFHSLAQVKNGVRAVFISCFFAFAVFAAQAVFLTHSAAAQLSCTSPAVLNAGTNLCDCPSPNIGMDGAAAPGVCAAPSAQSCESVTPAMVYDAAAGECALLFPVVCESPSVRNARTNLCDCPAPNIGESGAPAPGFCRGEYSLVRAAKDGNLVLVVRFIAAGAPVDATEEGYTPLQWAASQGHAHIIAELIAAGAGVNIRSSRAGTPLYLAGRRGVSLNPTAVSLLIEAGGHWGTECAAGEFVNPAGRNPSCIAVSETSCENLSPAKFYDAAAGECVAVADCLAPATLDADKNLCDCSLPNIGTNDASAPGDCAVPAPDETSCGGLSPAQFYDAAAGECVAFAVCAAPAVLDADENLCDCPSPNIGTDGLAAPGFCRSGFALHTAVRDGDLDFVRRFLAVVPRAEVSVFVNARNNGGWTPLHQAARFNRPAIALTLLAAGASVNASNNTHTPLSYAESNSNPGLYPHLIAAGGHWGTACAAGEFVNLAGSDPSCVAVSAANCGDVSPPAKGYGYDPAADACVAPSPESCGELSPVKGYHLVADACVAPSEASCGRLSPAQGYDSTAGACEVCSSGEGVLADGTCGVCPSGQVVQGGVCVADATCDSPAVLNAETNQCDCPSGYSGAGGVCNADISVSFSPSPNGALSAASGGDSIQNGGTVVYGATITFTAEPASGYTVLTWLGGCAGAVGISCEVVATADVFVWVEFFEASAESCGSLSPAKGYDGSGCVAPSAESCRGLSPVQGYDSAAGACEVCSSGEGVLADGTCGVCPSGQVVQGGVCVACESGQIVQGGVCVACESGQVVQGGVCVACASGQVVQGGVCVAAQDVLLAEIQKESPSLVTVIQALDAGADPDHKAGEVPLLIVAATMGHAEIVSVLVTAGADPDARWKRASCSSQTLGRAVPHVVAQNNFRPALYYTWGTALNVLRHFADADNQTAGATYDWNAEGVSPNCGSTNRAIDFLASRFDNFAASLPEESEDEKYAAMVGMADIMLANNASCANAANDNHVTCVGSAAAAAAVDCSPGLGVIYTVGSSGVRIRGVRCLACPVGQGVLADSTCGACPAGQVVQGGVCVAAATCDSPAVLNAETNQCDCPSGYSGAGGVCNADVTVSFSPPVNGTLSAASGGDSIQNGGTVVHGATVTFTAEPASGYAVSIWTGVCAGAVGVSCEAVATVDVSVGVEFFEEASAESCRRLSPAQGYDSAAGACEVCSSREGVLADGTCGRCPSWQGILADKTCGVCPSGQFIFRDVCTGPSAESCGQFGPEMGYDGAGACVAASAESCGRLSPAQGYLHLSLKGESIDVCVEPGVESCANLSPARALVFVGGFIRTCAAPSAESCGRFVPARGYDGAGACVAASAESCGKLSPAMGYRAGGYGGACVAASAESCGRLSPVMGYDSDAGACVAASAESCGGGELNPRKGYDDSGAGACVAPSAESCGKLSPARGYLRGGICSAPSSYSCAGLSPVMGYDSAARACVAPSAESCGGGELYPEKGYDDSGAGACVEPSAESCGKLSPARGYIVSGRCEKPNPLSCRKLSPVMGYDSDAEACVAPSAESCGELNPEKGYDDSGAGACVAPSAESCGKLSPARGYSGGSFPACVAPSARSCAGLSPVMGYDSDAEACVAASAESCGGGELNPRKGYDDSGAGACVAPSAESCGKLSPARGYISGSRCRAPSAQSCAGLSPVMGYDSDAEACVAPSAESCGELSPVMGYDSDAEACVAPSAESCRGLIPAQFYDAAARECVAFATCDLPEVRNAETNLCECLTGYVVKDGKCEICPPGQGVLADGTCGACPAEQVIYGGVCAACPSGYSGAGGVCNADVTVSFSSPANGGLSAASGGDFIQNGGTVAHGTTVTFTAAPASGYAVSIWTGGCAGAVGVSCEAVATADVSAGVEFFEEASCGRLSPAQGYDSVAGACEVCSSGEGVLADGTCGACPSGQGVLADNTCGACPSGQGVLADNTCGACPSGQGVLADNTCGACPARQFILGGACTAPSVASCGRLSPVKGYDSEAGACGLAETDCVSPAFLNVRANRCDCPAANIGEDGADAPGHCHDQDALVNAVFARNLELVSYFVTVAHRKEVSVIVNAPSRNGRLPLHEAASSGYVSIVATLIAANADVNARSGFAYGFETPLHMAALRGHVSVVSVLIAANAAVNARDSSYQTPLHHAASAGHVAVVSVLIAASAAVNARDSSYQTPLHHAADQEDIVSVLIAAGGHWGVYCGPGRVNPAGNSPPCLCESPLVKTNFDACEVVTVCDAPAVLNAGTNRCDCPDKQTYIRFALGGVCDAPSATSCRDDFPAKGYDSAADACVEPSAASCGELSPAKGYDSALAACVEPSPFHCGSLSPAKGYDSASAACVAPSAASCGELSPAKGYDDSGAGACVEASASSCRELSPARVYIEDEGCVSPDGFICGQLSPAQFYDSEADACVAVAVCAAPAVLNAETNRCGCPDKQIYDGGACVAPSGASCGGLSPARFYDWAVRECVANCPAPSVPNTGTNRCECPSGYSGDSVVCNADVTVSFSSPANGTLSAASGGGAIQDGGTVAHGATITFTASPARGYEVSIWTGGCVGAVGVSCETVATADVSAGVEFFEASAESCGELSPAKGYDSAAGACEVCSSGEGVLADGTCGACPSGQVIFGGVCTAPSAESCRSLSPAKGYDSAAKECVAVAAGCDLPAVRRAGTNLCDCPAPNIGENGAVAPGVCAAPSAEVCGRENQLYAVTVFHGTPVSACVPLADCALPAVRNAETNLCECPSGYSGDGGVCNADVTVSFSSPANGGLSAASGGDSIQNGGTVAHGTTVTFTAASARGYEVSIWTGVCAGAVGVSCEAVATANVSAGVEFFEEASAESCRRLSPAQGYDSAAGACEVCSSGEGVLADGTCGVCPSGQVILGGACTAPSAESCGELSPAKGYDLAAGACVEPSVASCGGLSPAKGYDSKAGACGLAETDCVSPAFLNVRTNRCDCPAANIGEDGADAPGHCHDQDALVNAVLARNLELVNYFVTVAHRKEVGVIVNALVNAPSGEERLPLHEAARLGSASIVATLIAAKADVNARVGSRSVTPLHNAAAGGHVAVVSVLIAANADVNARDIIHWTPLHNAAFSTLSSRVAVVSVLIAANADVNAREILGRQTPLRLALANNREDVVSVLIAAGGHWGVDCGPGRVNPAGASPPCLCESPLVKTNFDTCEVVAVCASPAVLNAGTNRCDCPDKQIHHGGACVAPGATICGELSPAKGYDLAADACVEPSASSCGELSPAKGYDLASAACVDPSPFHCGNLSPAKGYDSAAGACVAPGAESCGELFPPKGYDDSGAAACVEPSAESCRALSPAMVYNEDDEGYGVCFPPSALVCGILSPAQFYDSEADACAAVAVCASPAVLNAETNRCDCPDKQIYDGGACVAPSGESCGGLSPAQFYDWAVRECVANCPAPSVPNAGTNRCECPSGYSGDSVVCNADVTVSFSSPANGALSAASGGGAIQDGETVVHGATVTFTASPARGYEVSIWTGVCAGAVGVSCEAVATADVSAGVEFFEAGAESCGRLIPAKVYDAAARGCVANCPAPSVRNTGTNRCECPPGYSVDGGVCNADVTVSFSSPANGTLSAASGGGAIQDGETVVHGATITFTASPASGYEVSIWTGGCAGAVGVSCEAVATADVSAGVEFFEAGAESCGGLTPAQFYDAAARECVAVAVCDFPSVRNAETNQCECLTGYVVKDGKCEICPPGQGVLADGTCGVCPAEQVIYGGVCAACGSGQFALDGVCVAASAESCRGLTPAKVYDAAAKECVALAAECDLPAVRRSGTNLCDCPAPNIGENGAVAPGVCAAPSADVCGILSPAQGYDSAAGACEVCSSGEGVLADGTCGVCPSGQVILGGVCTAASADVCGILSPAQGYDSAAGACVAPSAESCGILSPAKGYDSAAGACVEPSVASCGGLSPAKGYDSEAGACGLAETDCVSPAFLNVRTNRCDCPAANIGEDGADAPGHCHDQDALVNAVLARNLELVNYFVTVAHRKEVSVIVNAPSRDGRLPLHEAASSGYVSIVATLIAANADVNARSIGDWTPLHHAVLAGNVFIVSVLIAANADVNARDITDRTPLNYAADGGHVAVVSVLIAANADVNARDIALGTPLRDAARGGHVAVVSVLIAANADVNARDASYQTPLHNAAAVGQDDVVPVLIAAGGHWGVDCGPGRVNPAGSSPPCLCESPLVKTNFDACEVVAVCALPAVLNAGTNRCDCPDKQIHHGGACVAPGATICGELSPAKGYDLAADACVEPSAESCGELSPAKGYDLALAACVEPSPFHCGNLSPAQGYDSAAAACVAPSAESCGELFPTKGYDDSGAGACVEPSAESCRELSPARVYIEDGACYPPGVEVCGALSPAQFYDSEADACAAVAVCASPAVLNAGTNRCDCPDKQIYDGGACVAPSGASCGGLSPAQFYDWAVRECVANCPAPSVPNTGTNRCECPSGYSGDSVVCNADVTVSFSSPANGALSAASGGGAIQDGETVVHGATVTFTAAPASGYEVSIWTGGCAGAVGVSCEAVATVDVSAGVEFFEANGESCGRLTPAEVYDLNANACVAASKEVCEGLTPEEFYDATARECVAVAVCTLPAVRNAETNLCEYVTVSFSSPANGTLSAASGGGAVQNGGTVVHGTTVTFTASPASGYEVSIWTGGCAGAVGASCEVVATADVVAGVEFFFEAGVESCGGLIPAQFYDATARECVALATCDLPEVRNAETNQCECLAGYVVKDGKCEICPPGQGVLADGTCGVCPAEQVIYGGVCAACGSGQFARDGVCVAASVESCRGLTPAEVYDAAAGACVAASEDVCKGLNPEEFYDATARECVAVAVCALPAVRNAETNLCECPSGYSGAGGVCNADVTVSFSSPANGTLSAASGGGAIQDGVTVAHGTTVTFTASPASGYEVSIWTGVCAGAVGASCEAVATVDVSAGVEFSEAGAEVCAGLIPAKFYDATAGECAAFATCDLPEVRNAETNQCECLAGYVVKDGKCEICPPGQGVLADGTCGVCPAEQVIYGGECVACESGQVALGGVCVAVADCPAGATLNSAENRCECAWDAVLNEAGTSCVCESPNVGTPEDCHAENALHRAAGLGDLDAVNHFIAAVHGGKSVVEVVNEENGAGETPLHQAARNGHAAVVAALIAAGAEVNAADTAGFTPLHQAALNGHVVIVLTLIAEKADVNMDDDNFGFTSLHQAANNGHVLVVSALIAAEADVNARTKQDRTPLWLADVRGRADVAAMLIAEGGHYGDVCASPAVVNPAGRDPSCVLCGVGRIDQGGVCVEARMVAYLHDPADGSGGTLTVLSLASGEAVPRGAAVTFTAIPAAGWYVEGWNNGGCAGDVGSAANPGEEKECDLPAEADLLVTVTFAVARKAVFGEGISASLTADGATVASGDTFADGTTIGFLATPPENHEIARWTNNGAEVCAGQNPCILEANGDLDVRAEFASLLRTIVYAALPGDGSGGTLTAPVSSGGTTLRGTTVTFTATPAAGWYVEGWNNGGCAGDVGSAASPGAEKECDLSAESNLLVTVTFAVAREVVYGEGLFASLTADGASVTSGDTFADGTKIGFLATPPENHEIARWTNNGAEVCAGQNPCVLEAAGDLDVRAEFASLLRTIVYEALPGDGSGGTLTASVPSGGAVLRGETATFTATPAAGWYVEEWTGDGVACAPFNGECEVTAADANLSVTALFAKRKNIATLSYAADPPEGGAVTVAGVTDDRVDGGTMVTFVATPAAGWNVFAWRGDGAGCPAANTCELAVNRNLFVTVRFEEAKRVEYGEVPSDQSGGTLTAPVSSGETTPHGTMVTFTATPAAGWYVEGWNDGGCAGDVGSAASPGEEKECALAADADLPVTVTFAVARKAVYGEGVSASLTADGATVASGDTVADGTKIGFLATPPENHEIARWTNNGEEVCAGQNPCVLEAKVDLDVRAVFKPVLRTIGYSALPGDNSGGALTGSVPSGGTAPHGATVTFTATPAAGWYVGGWNNDGCAGNVGSVASPGEEKECALPAEAGLLVTVTFAVVPGVEACRKLTPSQFYDAAEKECVPFVDCHATALPNADNSGCECPAGAFAHGDPATAECHAGHAPIPHGLDEWLSAIQGLDLALVAHFIFGHQQDPDDEGYHLHMAAGEGNLALAKDLIAGGANIDRIDGDRRLAAASGGAEQSGGTDNPAVAARGEGEHKRQWRRHAPAFGGAANRLAGKYRADFTPAGPERGSQPAQQRRLAAAGLGLSRRRSRNLAGAAGDYGGADSGRGDLERRMHGRGDSE